MSFLRPPKIDKLKSKSDIKGLKKCLKYEKDPSIAIKAVEAMGEIGNTECFYALTELLDDRRLISYAVDALGRIGDQRAKASIVKVIEHPPKWFKGESYYEFQCKCIRVLGKTGGSTTVESLFSFYIRPYGSLVINEIGSQLQRLGQTDRMVQVRMDEIKNTRFNGDDYLYLGELFQEINDTELKRRIIKFFIDEIKIWKSSQDKRSGSEPCFYIEHISGNIETLGNIGVFDDILIEMLQNPCEKMRRISAGSLRKFKDQKVVDAFVNSLGDPELDIRELAAKYLEDNSWTPKHKKEKGAFLAAKGKYDESAGFGKESAGPLFTAFMSHRFSHSKTIRPLIKRSLKKIGPPAVKTIVAFLNNKSWFVRQDAAEVLGEIGAPEAFEYLIGLIKDERVTGTVIDALGKIGNMLAVEPLISILKGEKKFKSTHTVAIAKLSALSALKNITGQKFGRDVDQWEKWWFNNKDKLLK